MERTARIKELNGNSEKYEGMKVREVADILQNATNTGVISNAGDIKFYSLRDREFKSANQISAEAVVKNVNFTAGYGFAQINATIKF
jgi:hypothetical protein